MKATITFDLPEDEPELRAAIDAMGHLGTIRDFYERLRTLNKYGHGFESADEAVSCLYKDYCSIMEAYINV